MFGSFESKSSAGSSRWPYKSNFFHKICFRTFTTTLPTCGKIIFSDLGTPLRSSVSSDGESPRSSTSVLTLENSYGHISALDDGSVYTIYQNANTGFVFEPISPYIGINTIKSDFEFTFNDKAPSISNFNVFLLCDY